MNRKISILIVLLLLATGFSLTREGTSSHIKRGPTRDYGDFEMDMDLSQISDGSFIGEAGNDHSGRSVAGVGDVNGDGYDDILIGAYNNDEGGNGAGQIYLIFGRETDFDMDMDLSDVDASFIGEEVGDYSGISVSGAGDVNGDGFHDILIGAYSNEEGGGNITGQTYIIFGKETGWSNDTSLENSDASFIGEKEYDYSGRDVAGAGDVNGDGYDDIIISAYGNDEGGNNSGQTYLIFGKETGWSMDTGLENVDASFLGEHSSSWSGYSISGSGDVNGDGYDDILISTPYDNEGGYRSGQTYLILGKSSGWSMDVNLTKADASFKGEDANDLSGFSVAGAGDVNGDGYDDILIGAPYDEDGGNNAGQTYLILGKASGWSMDTILGSADASFIGDDSDDHSGWSVSGAGDVNGDGYDDILIGAPADEEGGAQAGQTYLIFGKEKGWKMYSYLLYSDASFIGEDGDDFSGSSVSGAGDVNNDGRDDILIGAYGDEEGGGNNAGQTYLIKRIINSQPSEVYSFQAFRDPYANSTKIFDIGNNVYLELTGKDSNASHRDAAIINITFNGNLSNRFMLPLLETEVNSGLYRGHFILPFDLNYFNITSLTPEADPSFAFYIMVDYPYRPSSVSSVKVFSDENMTVQTDVLDFGEKAYFLIIGDDSNPEIKDKEFINISSDKNPLNNRMIICNETDVDSGAYIANLTVTEDMDWFENITITSARDPTKSDRFQVHTPIQIRPFKDIKSVYEDGEYSSTYWNFGYSDVTWNLDTNADWLEFDEATVTISGNPIYSDIGIYRVYLNASDDLGNLESRFFDLEVINTGAEILTEDVLEVYQDQYYEVDYDCDEDDSGTMLWFLDTNATWLSIEETTGVLKGTPGNDDVGIWPVIISVFDGVSASSKREFQIEVINVNDPPEILTEDWTEVNQGEPYSRDYVARDIDKGDSITWDFTTNAKFLKFEPENGILSGTPNNSHVGEWFVNLTVKDTHGETDVHNFTLTVYNINDLPVWEDMPFDTQVPFGSYFIFDVNATDIDPDSTLSYSIETEPDVDIGIDDDTGLIEWEALYQGGNNRIKVTLYATDGKLTIEHRFVLEVAMSNSPKTRLMKPNDQDRVSGKYVNLEWSGEDLDGDEITYDVYLNQALTPVTCFRGDCLILKDYSGDFYNLSGLEEGKTYYWTVVPSDYCSCGECLDGVFSFRVNNIPRHRDYDKQEAVIGEEFRMALKIDDGDQEDRIRLRYTLLDAPEGLELDEESGTLIWKPGSGDKGEHTVVFSVTDGIDTVMGSVDIEVVESDGGGLSIGLWTLITVALILVIVVAIGLGVMVLMKQHKIEEAESELEANELEKEIEKKRKFEEEYGLKGSVNHESEEISDVPLDFHEAHAHDRDPKEYTYEDLYDQPESQQPPEYPTEDQIEQDPITSSTEEGIPEEQNPPGSEETRSSENIKSNPNP